MQFFPRNVPAAPLILGFVAILPFAGYLLALLTGQIFAPAQAADGMALYAALILSFLGGVQWGLAMVAHDAEHMPSARRLLISVLPAVLGWLALLALPVRFALIVLALGFAAVLAYDMRVVARGDAPTWYAPLRKTLTLIVITILLIAALIAF